MREQHVSYVPRTPKQVPQSCISNSSLDKTPSVADCEPSEALVSDLLKFFQGEFDNYDQARGIYIYVKSEKNVLVRVIPQLYVG